MTVEEDKERGNLTITVNLEKVGAYAYGIIYLLQKLILDLNKAATERDIDEIESKYKEKVKENNNHAEI